MQGAEQTQTLGGHRYPRDNPRDTTPFVGRKMREGSENIVGLHAARGCRGAAQASKGMSQAFADTVLVEGAEKTERLGGHHYPRGIHHYKTPFVGRKRRKGNGNIVGLNAARGCRGAVQASKGMYQAFADTMLVHGAETPPKLGGHCYPRDNEHHTTPLESRKLREGNENIVVLHDARGCRGAVQAAKGMYEAFADPVLVQETAKTQILIGRRYPRDSQHYKTPVVGRKMRKGSENNVGLHATRGCRGAV